MTRETHTAPNSTARKRNAELHDANRASTLKDLAEEFQAEAVEARQRAAADHARLAALAASWRVLGDTYTRMADEPDLDPHARAQRLALGQRVTTMAIQLQHALRPQP